jgi:ribosomal protein S18 acetylase RimI-like enzyme
MIKAINQRDNEIATEIASLQKLSYHVEAEIIGYSAIPPLHESIAEIINSKEIYLAFYEEQHIAGILAYEFEGGFIIISKMMVHPDHFKKGIATKLIDYLFRIYSNAWRAKVSTGAKNYPAIRLYLKHGFVKTGERIIDNYLTLYTFEKELTNSFDGATRK